MTHLPTSPGIYLCLILFGLVALYPTQASEVLERASLELQIMILNWRLKRAQYRLYKQLQKDHKERGWPALPPFEFVPIQHRGKK